MQAVHSFAPARDEKSHSEIFSHLGNRRFLYESFIHRPWAHKSLMRNKFKFTFFEHFPQRLWAKQTRTVYGKRLNSNVKNFQRKSWRFIYERRFLIGKTSSEISLCKLWARMLTIQQNFHLWKLSFIFTVCLPSLNASVCFSIIIETHCENWVWINLLADRLMPRHTRCCNERQAMEIYLNDLSWGTQCWRLAISMTTVYTTVTNTCW